MEKKTNKLKHVLKFGTSFTSHNFDKNSVLINLGGGLIGDLGGFCASTYKKEELISYKIPTSLLAMIDAYRRKTGVNFKKLKKSNWIIFFSKISHH